jgi:acyl-CoA oxidase
MTTTATYDDKTDEFVLHTPDIGSQKYWITNGAMHADTAIVFAQLAIAGEQHGVHAFLCPIRDAKGAKMPGVKIEDMGWKMALNGVDNAKLSFDHVRVPRENLLDRYSRVAKGGAFESDIPKIHLRCLSSFGLAGAKLCLTIAVRYSAQRRQFSPAPGEPPFPILRYLSQQRALFPKIAATYALTIALNTCKDRFAELRPGDTSDEATASNRATIGLICALKPLCTWHLSDTALVCRERCGGQGFLAANGLGRALSESGAAVTAEGDDIVLCFKAARELLVRFAAGVRSAGAVSVFLGHLARRARFAAIRLAGGDLRTIDYQRALLEEREERLLFMLASAMKGKRGSEAFHTWNDNIPLGIALARAYGERYTHARFAEVAAAADPAVRPALQRLCSLYGLSCIQNSVADFCRVGIVSPAEVRACDDEISNLCRTIGDEAETLVEGFGIPDAIVKLAPIGGDYVAFNKMK